MQKPNSITEANVTEKINQEIGTTKKAEAWICQTTSSVGTQTDSLVSQRHVFVTHTSPGKNGISFIITVHADSEREKDSYRKINQMLRGREKTDAGRYYRTYFEYDD